MVLTVWPEKQAFEHHYIPPVMCSDTEMWKVPQEAKLSGTALQQAHREVLLMFGMSFEGRGGGPPVE